MNRIGASIAPGDESMHVLTCRLQQRGYQCNAVRRLRRRTPGAVSTCCALLRARFDLHIKDLEFVAGNHLGRPLRTGRALCNEVRDIELFSAAATVCAMR